MRHRVDHRKLNRTASHRKAMLCNMVTSLFNSERITTTDAKAKEARRLAEKLITRARKGYSAHQEGIELREAGKEEEARQMEAVALAHWRQAGRYVRNVNVLKKLFEKIAPQFLEREGGYTRVIQVNRRLGDNAKTVLLELVGGQKAAKPSSKKGEGEPAAEGDKAAKKTKAKSKAKASQKDQSGEKKKPSKKTKTKTKAKDKTKDKEEKADKKAGSKSKSKSKSKKKTKG